MQHKWLSCKSCNQFIVIKVGVLNVLLVSGWLFMHSVYLFFPPLNTSCINNIFLSVSIYSWSGFWQTKSAPVTKSGKTLSFISPFKVLSNIFFCVAAAVKISLCEGDEKGRKKSNAYFIGPFIFTLISQTFYN